MDKRALSGRVNFSPSWFSGGGAMGERIRSMDWGRTPLGPIERWPLHLHLILAVCLASDLPMAIYWGSEFNLLYNDAFSVLVGGKHPAILGCPARDAWPEARDFFEARLHQLAGRGEAFFRQDQPLCLNRHGYTEECYFDLALSPILGPTGDIDGVFCTMVETSGRVLAMRRQEEDVDTLRAAEERLRYLNEAAGVGCWDWDVVADRGECTERCRAIFALPPDLPLNYPCFLKCVHPDDRERTDAAMQRALGRGGDYDVEYRIIWPDGSEHWVQSKGRVDFGADARPRRMAGIVVDVTARKLAEAAIEAHKARLEEEVAARTAQLVAANKELQAFAYGVAHDLKSPLRGIVSYSQLLSMEYGDRLHGAGAEFLEQIQKSVGRMRALIDDLLAYSRIEQGSQKVQPLPLPVAVRRVLAEREEDMRRAGVELRCDPPPVNVVCDPEGLAQVLRNLVDNALKFSTRAAPPVIEIGGEADGSRCRLWVRDNGLGFDMAQHDRIFELFQRLHRADDIPGTGIGLALVKKAMERIGGRVWAESAPGRGATFFLELPVQESGRFG